MFQILAPVQLALGCFFAALLAASAVAHEKDRRTLILLLLTRLSNCELVLGKLAASLLGVLMMLATAWPVFFLAALLGGVSAAQIARVFAVTLLSVLACGSLGSVLALWREKTFQAVAMTVLAMVLWLAHHPIIQVGQRRPPRRWSHRAITRRLPRAISPIPSAQRPRIPAVRPATLAARPSIPAPKPALSADKLVILAAKVAELAWEQAPPRWIATVRRQPAGVWADPPASLLIAVAADRIAGRHGLRPMAARLAPRSPPALPAAACLPLVTHTTCRGRRQRVRAVALIRPQFPPVRCRPAAFPALRRVLRLPIRSMERSRRPGTGLAEPVTMYRREGRRRPRPRHRVPPPQSAPIPQVTSRHPTSSVVSRKWRNL